MRLKSLQRGQTESIGETIGWPHPTGSFVMKRDLHSNDSIFKPGFLYPGAGSRTRDSRPMNEGNMMHVAQVLHYAEV